MTSTLHGDQSAANLASLAADSGVVVGARSATTTLPKRPSSSAASQQRRTTRGLSRADVLRMAGSAVSALCTTMLIFGVVTPLSGRLGFVVVGFGIFLATYAVLVSITEEVPTVIDKVMTMLLGSAAVVALGALFSVVFFTLWRGRTALGRTNTFLHDLSSTGPQDGLGKGGIAHAVVGTMIITGLAMIITVPLGLACSVYLTENTGRLAELVRTVVTAMTALPSILAGLLIFSTWIIVLGFQRSGLAASFAVSIVMLPIIIRAADVVLRLVPGNLREAAAALGAPRGRTVWHVVLPTARSGLTTSVILGVARGIGETAPVLLTAGYTATMNLNPSKDPMVSLPLVAFKLVSSPLPTQIARGFAAASVLMVLVLVLFTVARILGGRPVGRLSKGQDRRAAARSANDRSRIEARQGLRP